MLNRVNVRCLCECELKTNVSISLIDENENASKSKNRYWYKQNEIKVIIYPHLIVAKFQSVVQSFCSAHRFDFSFCHSNRNVSTAKSEQCLLFTSEKKGKKKKREKIATEQ